MIETLVLTDFRNHISCRIKTHGRQNVIVTGPNGAGKTAILEALSILSGDRGMRGAQMTDIVRFNGNGGFSVFATLDDETEISVVFNPGDTNRHGRIDGDTATLSGLAEKLPMVWITPREDRLFVDSSAERRAFFDRLVAGFDSAHSGRVARFAKLLSERAVALKSGRDMRWVDVIDDHIAATATAIAAARIQYAGELNYFLENAAVSVAGMLEQMLIDGHSTGDTERTYREYLGTTREIIADKMIIDGVHKSDFGVFNKTLNLPANLTSTGQQKTTLLELILAHAKLMHAHTNRRPIILLDEAIAHLDDNARQNLFAGLDSTNAQIWATGIDANAFDNVPNAVFVSCADGEISNILVSKQE
ncbi:MAG: DNA replication and repair protein RecF [Alphaproteobacteria bacterium]|nr:DNA replication and repair protein RecF [Alphaproteobacteria bacterium]